MYYVYMLASRRNGTLYTGVTGRIIVRVSQHKQKLTEGFTSRYGVDLLVWYEPHENVEVAIRREKRLKKWLRAWKVALIEQTNPLWLDLYPEFFATPPGPLTGVPTSSGPDSPLQSSLPFVTMAPQVSSEPVSHVPHHR